MSLFKVFADTSAVGIVKQVNWVFTTIIGILVAYKFVYLIIGFFKAKRWPETDKTHNYAFLIAARNEEMVIGNLIDSIRKNNYPQDKITIFVIADNCTDNTAKVCRDRGCIVYERHNKVEIGKGYALNVLVDQISKDYGINAYDGYFVFDADNLLHPDYIKEMNKVFSSGEKMITSYRNTKNFDANFISAGYGYHHYRTLRSLHIARTRLGLSCCITGTGFLISNEILRNGWPWKLITEDIEMTVDKAIEGYKVVYCHDAIFYDEQPVSFKIMFRQRLRWAKGFLLVFKSHFWKLLRGMFSRKPKATEAGTPCTQNGHQHRFTCYDLFFHVSPIVLITFAWSILYDIALIIVVSLSGMSVGACFLEIGKGLLSSILTLYITTFIQIIPVVICEWKNINTTAFKKIFYLFTFPIFDLFNMPIMAVALFTKVQWKPIPRTSTAKIEDIITSKNSNNSLEDDELANIKN